VIGRGDSVVSILTGNLLKDPEATVRYHSGEVYAGVKGTYANRPISIRNSVDAVRRELENWL